MHRKFGQRVLGVSLVTGLGLSLAACSGGGASPAAVDHSADNSSSANLHAKKRARLSPREHAVADVDAADSLLMTDSAAEQHEQQHDDSEELALLSSTEHTVGADGADEQLSLV